jgi:hypothetical protein
MNLNATDTLKLVTSSTSALDVIVAFKDDGPNASPLRSQETAITSAATTTICAAPGVGTCREIESITVRNKGAASNTVTLAKVVGATTYEGYEVGVGAEGHLLWLPGVGWTLTTPNTLGVSNVTILQDAVVNDLASAGYADVTGLSFAVTADLTYWFRFVVRYDAAATTTGSGWAINGPTSPTYLHGTSTYTLTATSETNNSFTAYDIPAAANATSLTTGNIAVVEGFITPSASGTVILRSRSEVNSSAITALAGSTLEWKRVL